MKLPQQKVKKQVKINGHSQEKDDMVINKNAFYFPSTRVKMVLMGWSSNDFEIRYTSITEFPSKHTKFEYTTKSV